MHVMHHIVIFTPPPFYRTHHKRIKDERVKAFYGMCKVTRTWPWVWNWDLKVLPFYCAYVATLSNLYTLQYKDERVKAFYGMCKVIRTWPWVWTWDLKVILFYCTYVATLSNLYFFAKSFLNLTRFWTKLKERGQTHKCTNFCAKLSFIRFFTRLLLHIFSLLHNYYIYLEPCAFNVEFQHFIPRFNKTSLLCYLTQRGDKGWKEAQR
jgi:hypothetical protein